MEVMALSGNGGNEDILASMYQMRARVFRDRLGWSVSTRHGFEIDEFDTPATQYILVVAQGQVLGCARFLDFSGPTMIGSKFSHLSDRPLSSFSASCVESSRFCVDTRMMRARKNSERRDATSLLVSGMIAWAALCQYHSIATVTDVGVERLLRRLDLPFTRLGPPRKLERTRAVAGLVPVSASLASKVAPPSCRAPISNGCAAA